MAADHEGHPQLHLQQKMHETEDIIVSSTNSAGERWRGRMREEIKAPLERVWALGSDFCGLKKWTPSLDFCVRTEGENQKAGCVRYVGGGGTFHRTDGETMSWAKERLLYMNEKEKCYSYAMEDGNMGLKGYVAIFQLFQGQAHNSNNHSTCTTCTTIVDWSFEMDPIKGSSKEEIVGRQIAFLGAAAKRLERVANTADPMINTTSWSKQ